MRGNKIARGLLLAAAAVLPGSAWAINKCTQPDGKVVYQDAPCDSQAKAAEVKTWSGPSRSSRLEGWTFRRSHDAMTGQVACMAISSITFPVPGPESKFLPVHAVLLATSTVEVLGIRTSDDKDLFHHDLSSTGLRTDNGEFIPFTRKTGSHVLGTADSDRVIRDLEKSKELLVRVRFWPYDKLHDMVPIPSAGFTAAREKARECAKL